MQKINTKLIKILHVISDYSFFEIFLKKQLLYFSNLDIEWHVACTPNAESEMNSMKSTPVKFYYTSILRSISPLIDCLTIIKLRRYIKINKFDIVIGHTPKGALLGMVSSWLAGTRKRVYYRHGLIFETSRGISRVLFKIVEKLTASLATHVVCVSPSILEVSDNYRLNDSRKNIIIGKRGSINGINTDIFYKATLDKLVLNKLREKLGISAGKIVVGFVGRLVHDKGVAELLDAWRSLILDNKEIVLLIVGDTDSRDSISNHYLQYIVSEKTVVHIKKEQNMPLVYALMDMFVLPSYREGLPTVILEASSMELPIITTRVTGCVDVVVQNKSGIFCDNTAKSIKEKIQYYLNESEARARHGIYGRKFVKYNFEQHEIWKETLKKLFYM